MNENVGLLTTYKLSAVGMPAGKNVVDCLITFSNCCELKHVEMAIHM